MKIKYTLLPLLMFALGLSSCSLLTPQRSITPDPTSEASSADPTSGSSKESSESKQSSESSATSVSSFSSEIPPVSYDYSLTYHEINTRKSSSVGDYSYIKDVNTKQDVFNEMMQDAAAFELENGISETSFNINRRDLPATAADLPDYSVAYVVEYSPKTITINVSFKNADTGVVTLGDTTEYTESSFSSSSAYNFVWGAINDFESEHDVEINKSGAPEDEDECIYEDRDYIFTYQEINEEEDYFNITYQVILYTLKSARGGRPQFREVDITSSAVISGPTSVVQGNSFSFSVSYEEEDNMFGYWTSSSEVFPISGVTSGSYTPDEDITITAYYCLNSEDTSYFKLFLSNDFSIEEDPSSFQSVDDEVSFTATFSPKIQKRTFEGWKDVSTGQIVSTSLSYTFTMPNRPYVLVPVTGSK